MMFVRKTRAVAVKELRQILRDRRTLLILLFVPAFFLLVYGYALNFDVRHIRLGVQDKDRSAVSRCASAAMTQAQAQYGGYGYNQGYNRGGGYNAAGGMRVTSSTDVQRRANGLRVKGTMSSGYGYGSQYGYQNQAYAQGNVTFRCNVAYNGAVTDIRIGRNGNYRRY